MSDTVVRIEDIKNATAALAERLDAYYARADDARDDAKARAKKERARWIVEISEDDGKTTRWHESFERERDAIKAAQQLNQGFGIERAIHRSNRSDEEDARDDATRKEKYLALKGPEQTTKITPVLPAAKPITDPAPRGTPAAQRKDPKVQAASSLANALESLRGQNLKGKKLGAAVAERISGLSMSRQASAPLKSDIDPSGVRFKDGEAFYKGMVVRPGGRYHPMKGILLRRRDTDAIFVCTRVGWEQSRTAVPAGPRDRVVAEGYILYETEGAPAERANVFVYIPALKPLEPFKSGKVKPGIF